MYEDKDLLSIDVAKMYYELDRNQNDIAKALDISRPTVSKLLKHAKEKNFVSIIIHDPRDQTANLEAAIRKKYKLDTVRIAFAPVDEEQEIKKYLGKTTAEYLNEIIKDGDMIGVTWGSTLYEVAKALQPKDVKGIEVIQLKGGMSYSHNETHDNDIMRRFTDAYKAFGQFIPLPVIFDSIELKNLIAQDRHIAHVLQQMNRANIALYTIGSVSEDSLLYKMNYITEDEFKQLQEQAVGEICSRFFGSDGRICNEQLNTRTFGIELEDLKNKEKAVLIAGGKSKVNAIDTALSHKFANTLITDRFTANKLMKL
ncbi:sugar-binding transcriptional regulator [Bacillus sp. AGMB 02131]|uniref:Sugar-binding transcriptional regulator n=1 Tax=Peribacillus faecalis TaxID=2772559 RepID=A0A927CUX7_9BACI|nr:sugar-binding transcriptional regulator [Peribacillus faecalis]MBD3108273.1 sugar-binding transcriptional regulator [Peribacillus faecalis]